MGNPQVAYRETIRKTVEQETKFVRQSGGRGQYGHVYLRIEPLPQGTGYEFEKYSEAPRNVADEIIAKNQA